MGINRRVGGRTGGQNIEGVKGESKNPRAMMSISPTHSPQLPAPPLPILESPPATQSPPSPPSPTIPPPTTPSSPSPPSPPSPPSQTPPTSKPPPTSSPSNSSDSSPPLPKTDNGPGQSTPTTSQSSLSPVGLSHISTPGFIAIIIAGTLVLLFLAVCTVCFFRKKKMRRPQPPSLPYVLPKGTYREPANRRSWFDHASSYLSNISAKMPPPPPFTLTSRIYGGIVKPDLPSELPAMVNARSCFTFEELKEATNNFSAANFLGEGGFGCVYKGKLLDGQAVAVKQLRVGGRQGEREFRAEVDIISRVHHRHLVSLVGYSIAENQRLLVYEYVPNRTLEYHLHGKERPVMNWRNRHKIAVGAARGLAYLHEDCHPRIIHRDIKSSNILLDDNFEARVSDFGLAKLFYDADTHVTTRVMGTFGYLAPEYASSGKLTEKSDVFSFGVVLLELISGLKPLDATLPGGIENLVEWGHPLLTQILEGGNLELAVDPKLNGNYDKSEMMSMVHAASACIRYSAYKRPKMSQVVKELEDGVSISDGSNNEGMRPGNSNVAYASSSNYGGRL